jgi:hypothetical protein
MAIEPFRLSAFDPVVSEEGGIDPFSLQGTYERLAERILPFITVRMARPRFLTAIAVGAVVCQKFRDEVAADRVTPAWLVFEWYVIEAFVRARAGAGDDSASRIPGIQKLGEALRTGRAVSAATYLKTPRVFGFTGVYRRLAKGLRIVDDDLGLDDGGFELVRIWADEQGLEGFNGGSRGPGAALRDALQEAVADGLGKGHTARTGGWVRWRSLAKHLAPGAAPPQERRWLYERLLDSGLEQNPHDPQAAEVRREFLTAVRFNRLPVNRNEEKEYLGFVGARGSPALRRRLALIDAYERISRALTDASDLILSLGGRGGAPEVHVREFAEHPLARRISRDLPGACRQLDRRFRGPDADDDVVNLLTRYRPVRSPEQLFSCLIDHHEEAQREKPPEGKRPWVERGRGDRVFVRPRYRLAHPPDGNGTYVHDYRTATCCSFLRDLGRLR